MTGASVGRSPSTATPSRDLLACSFFAAASFTLFAAGWSASSEIFLFFRKDWEPGTKEDWVRTSEAPREQREGCKLCWEGLKVGDGGQSGTDIMGQDWEEGGEESFDGVFGGRESEEKTVESEPGPVILDTPRVVMEIGSKTSLLTSNQHAPWRVKEGERNDIHQQLGGYEMGLTVVEQRKPSLQVNQVERFRPSVG
jgi:hypothetical protein